MIDIPNRSINVALDESELAARRIKMHERGERAWHPIHRDRIVSQALKAYALMTTSADRGAVRDLDQITSKVHSNF